jgi:hypothetical protein
MRLQRLQMKMFSKAELDLSSSNQICSSPPREPISTLSSSLANSSPTALNLTPILSRAPAKKAFLKKEIPVQDQQAADFPSKIHKPLLLPTTPSFPPNYEELIWSERVNAKDQVNSMNKPSTVNDENRSSIANLNIDVTINFDDAADEDCPSTRSSFTQKYPSPVKSPMKSTLEILHELIHDDDTNESNHVILDLMEKISSRRSSLSPSIEAIATLTPENATSVCSQCHSKSKKKLRYSIGSIQSELFVDDLHDDAETEAHDDAASDSGSLSIPVADDPAAIAIAMIDDAHLITTTHDEVVTQKEMEFSLVSIAIDEPTVFPMPVEPENRVTTSPSPSLPQATSSSDLQLVPAAKIPKNSYRMMVIMVISLVLSLIIFCRWSWFKSQSTINGEISWSHHLPSGPFHYPSRLVQGKHCVSDATRYHIRSLKKFLHSTRTFETIASPGEVPLDDSSAMIPIESAVENEERAVSYDELESSYKEAVTALVASHANEYDANHQVSPEQEEVIWRRIQLTFHIEVDLPVRDRANSGQPMKHEYPLKGFFQQLISKLTMMPEAHQKILFN